MESAKPSVRFRSTMLADSAVSNASPTAPGSIASPESLRVSDSEWFNTDGYVEPKYQSLTEKGIRLLCSELLELKKASAEEMRRNVYANYSAFIRTSQELSELETELMAMRTLISTQAVLVRDLLEGVYLQSSSSSRGTIALQESAKLEEDREPLDLEKRFQVLSDALDVYLAERRIDEALAALNEGERIVSDAHREDLEPATSSSFKSALSERKARLVAQLVEAAWQPTVRNTELRKVVSILNQLGDGSHAHTLLLNSYHARLQNGVKNMRPTCSWYTGAYTATLAQLFFSTISQASRDSLNIFGNVPACASELVLWACKETEEYVLLVKKHVLSFSEVAGGIRAAVDCVQISLGHCSLLEDQGLSLCPLLLKLVKPYVEGVMDKSLARIEEALRAHVASDNWVLTDSPVQAASQGGPNVPVVRGLSSHLKLSSSAHRFNSMVQDLLEDVTPLMSMQFGRVALEGISNLFGSYVEMLNKALPGDIEREDGISMKEDSNVQIAETEAQQLTILGSAAALADELLPCAALRWQQSASKEELWRQAQDRPITSGTRLSEQKDWRRRLQRAVDRLRDHFCRHHALELVYNKNGEPLLTAEIYLSLYDNGKDQFWRQDPMPSPPFQALFMKLNRLAQLAADVLAGRERVVVLLLMRLTETVVMWLSNDEDFWGTIEDGPKTLGPIGLQQFVLDMQFVIQIASSGRYSSRSMRQSVLAIISRAVNAFSATGIDPNSFLPEDEWFEDTAKETIRKILAGMSRSNAVPNEQEPGSPTSISGLSSVQGNP